MLDNQTKKRIDDCRNILVGKITDPKSQVEQITIALIYKFMDDMDLEAVEMGGVATYFVGEYEKYAWHNIFSPRIGGEEMLALYGEGMVKMNLNPHLPQLFRDIFKNAYLPYRDPETLKLFLKTINEFSYDHSERLGDAFEYLLSVLGSQGDAGQFRTPRHIIDFIIRLLNPDKNGSMLDPSSGTCGFLISAFKHVITKYTKNQLGDMLTPADRKKLMENFTGYDISPDMVRLSLVNLFLHGFTNPKVYEYDTLTSEERWNEYFDYIFANPPFMSPKGGIRPHKRFGIESNRAEVLFIDYIMEHLTPKGKAGIVVPEGIIFQSGKAYVALRKSLVEKYLVGVISLPSGVFNPYSGVKTSILIIDRELSQKSDKIFFAKVENDGYDLGAQRREIEKNDLPIFEVEISRYLGGLRNDEVIESEKLNFVTKEQILGSSDVGLSYEKYISSRTVYASEYLSCKLSELLEIQSGFPFESKLFNDNNGFPLIRIRNIKKNYTDTFYNGEYSDDFVVKNGDLLIGMDGEFNCVLWNGNDALLNQRVCRIRSYKNILKEYTFYMIQKKLKEIEDETNAVTVKHISVKQILNIEIPLPPLEVQQEIVNELEQYQKIIDENKRLIEIYTQKIQDRINKIWGN
jgi:type I restriction enzyme M protein